MNRQQIRSFIAGVLVTLMMFSVVFAAPVTKSIKAAFEALTMQVNGRGVKVDTIVYNNTLYAPVKTIAESLGKEFKQDPKTKIVSINDKKPATPPAPPAPINSRNNPAGIGQKFTVKTAGILSYNAQYEITMTEIKTGEDAWTMVYQGNKFNDEPAEGKEYILAKFKVKLLNIDENKTFNLNRYTFDLVSSKGVLYNDFTSVSGLNPDLSTELYKDAEIEGWTFFLVDKADSPVCVVNRGTNNEVWFNLRAK